MGHIFKPGKKDYPLLTTIWEASVRATHHFLSEQEILFYKPLVEEDYLPSADLYCITDGLLPCGFMGIAGSHLEMLFVHPDTIGQGYGKQLLEYAIQNLGVSTVDVNEQNTHALDFYLYNGFEITGRDALDGQGRPFPILHLKLTSPEPISINAETALYRIRLSDAQEIFRAIDTQREYLGKWLPFVAGTKRLSDSETFVKSIVYFPFNKQEPTFVIRRNGTFAGLIGFVNTDRTNRKTEIGYWLCKQFQGQGIMTSAVKILCDMAFREAGLNRIQIKCAVGNLPSNKIPLRLGFVTEGVERAGEQIMPGKFLDLNIYSKLKTENTLFDE